MRIGSHFFAYLSRMRFIQRWALMRNTAPENVQEHSHQVAVLAHALAVIRNEKFGGHADAGAVAVAIAPRHIATGSGIRSVVRASVISTASTNSVVVSACVSVITKIFLPMRLKLEILNSTPIEKAINASATSVIMLKTPSRSVWLIILKQHGPRIMPIIR